MRTYLNHCLNIHYTGGTRVYSFYLQITRSESCVTSFMCRFLTYAQTGGTLSKRGMRRVLSSREDSCFSLESGLSSYLTQSP